LSTLDDALGGLERAHREILEWYAEHAGTEQSWPDKLPDGILVASKGKAIYKPEWTRYAVSVRQNLSGRYPDKPEERTDGTWSYQYFQEGADPANRDRIFTNRGLMECMKDEVPVGVMRQTKAKPSPRYKVLGIAQVVDWRDGWFILEGFSKSGIAKVQGERARLRQALEEEAESAESRHEFDPASIEDARRRTARTIVQRRGQRSFRQDLMEAYARKCTVTNCSTAEVLEAAHIFPYMGPETNDVTNGLLLRADVHLLFDLGLIEFEPVTFKVKVSQTLAGTEYEQFNGAQLHLPKERELWPSNAALQKRLAMLHL
jgi:putative restriction endonuclease